MTFAANVALTDAGLGVITGRIKGTATEPSYFGIGIGATAAARTAGVSDSALSTPSGSRTVGQSAVVTTTKTNDTYRVIGNVTAGGTLTYDECGLFDASTSGNLVVSATITPISVINGDTVQFTFKTKFTN